ncbi:HEAT repeat domain-containing protein [Paramaledivibacter caminithermalis]|jgi:HEAT repeat protein|uniref:HEAT repeat-containing protein n=1 Tax=Paramaledivibacter caminithermalis (strain DSM 15212 / CIP 107654 / DViRD3) TaxID=1121301 RepID=A0A1M6PD06_PARC5|nr:HEAT repeat domain-containing protein [Paramaledivibacter caminithermalis]SHK05814.1 HEAT repeat-containing protein [Paramaledivibacter caminithermalis DSM 15212]
MGTSKKIWDNIERVDDCIITYMLYKEGKPIEIISKIRNISKERVEKDIIDAKIKLRTIKVNHHKKSLLDNILELSKDERFKFINEESQEKLEELTKEIKMKYRDIKNQEDKATLIWLIGELRDTSLLSLLSKDALNNNGNIRRMVCSALGKIGSQKALPILHRALRDNKPQVRQYAAKALKDIGNKSSLHILNEIIDRSNEKDYVKRACLKSIESINMRLI